MAPNRLGVMVLAALGTTLTASTAFGQLFPIDQPARPTGPVVETPQNTPDQPQRTAGNGRIVFFSTDGDTGEIYDTENATVEFKFRNVGSDPLTITRIQPSCGCTVPEMEKTVFEPNEVGTMKVLFDPRGRQGHVARSIQVFTDSRLTPTTTINVKSFVKPVVVSVPSDVVAFDSVNKGEEVVREVRVFGRFPDFEVTRASTNDPMLYEVEVIPAGEATVLGETMYERIVRVTLKGSAAPGQHNSSLTIRTNDERRSIFSLPLVGRVVGDLELSPVRMTLGRLSVGDEFEREIRVRHRKGEAFEITGAHMANPAIDAEYTFEPIDAEDRSEWLVRAKGRVNTSAPRFNATLNLITDVQGEELTPVMMTGVLRPN